MNVIQKKMTVLIQKRIQIDYTLDTVAYLKNVFIIIYISIIMNNIQIIVSTLAPYNQLYSNNPTIMENI